jgi:hypothetical protein
MRSKRKASSPTEKPGKSATKAPAIPKDLPVLETKDIFGSSEFAARPSISNSSVIDRVLESSEDDAEMYELPITNDLPARPNLRGFFSVRAARRADLGLDGSRKLSAVLISPDDENTSGSTTAYQSADRFRYIPLGPAHNGILRSKVEDNALLTIVPTYRSRIRQSCEDKAPSNFRWPLHKLPVEMFDLITGYLSRDDVKCMRLVNREFEQKVSRSLFHTSVVPFNTELYDMIDEDKKNIAQAFPYTGGGKGKMRAFAPGTAPSLSQFDARSLLWQNAKEDKDGKVYKGHGLRVFRGFGPHIKRFGMSFEVSERQLSQTLAKKELDHIEAYHGSYDWPSQHYTRFANLAGLENTADETSRMKAAFANLEIAQELALSIDSGLGWLNGPDKSVRARLFERPSPVFGTAYDVPDHATQAATAFWAAIQQSQLAFDPGSNLAEVNLEGSFMASLPSDLQGLRGKIYGETRRWPVMRSTNLTSSERLPQIPLSGVVYTTNRLNEPGDIEILGLPLAPNSLKKEQKEWLLETQWAQQAFFESYMLAVIDNPCNFSKVTTLNIAKLSSRFLSMLARPYFWDALPCLADVTLRVNADWRSVDKDDAGVVVVRPEYPSHAIRMFHKDVVRDRVSTRESIKKLTIGWVGGGELAQGVHARNNNILPAPITQVEHSTANSSVFGLVFKHVEHLTLSNCWITPPTLEGLVKSHASKALKKLTLDSVSLTAHPKFPINANAGNVQQQVQQMLAALPGQGGNNGQQIQQIAQGAPPGINLQGLGHQQLAALQQHWQVQLQQMQQIFNGNPNAGIAAHMQQMQHFLQATQNAAANIAFNPNPLNPANFLPLPPPGGANAVNAVAQPPPPPPAQAMPQAAPAPAAVNNPVPATATHWTSGHREGSWPDILNTISPGPILADYLPAPQPWEEQLPIRHETNLHTIELKSCGYLKLPRLHTFDQMAVEADFSRPGRQQSMSLWFAKRWAALRNVMMEAKDRMMGQIVQYMPLTELNALQFAWGVTEGWGESEKAEESTYDGCLPGGTGRVSGVIEKGMALVGETAAGPSSSSS